MEEKISSLFEAAFRMHQAGQLADANRLYTEILDLNPNHFDALHLSGLIAAQAGTCLLYTSPSPRDRTRSRMPSSA